MVYLAAKIRFGHASTGNPASGQVEDEVKIGGYYSLPPTVLLRPKSATLAEKSAAACEAGCNNDKIEYSQASRNTLKAEAEKVGYKLSKITTTCYADCSSFMTVCAIAGGATFSYGYGGGSNAPTTSNMRNWFTKNGDYEALTNSIYLTGTDYLKRGDILVNEGSHTVMVLDNGSKVLDNSGIDTDANNSEISTDTSYLLDIVTTNVTLIITEAAATTVKATAKITKIKNGEEKPLNSTQELKEYIWKCGIRPLASGDTTEKFKAFKVTSGTIKFSMDNLIPNTRYAIRFVAVDSEGTIEFSSPTLLVTTSIEYPSAVKNLKAIFSDKNLPIKKCIVTFDAPDSWGTASMQKGYRVDLIINGKIVAFSDTLCRATANSVRKEIYLADLAPNITINHNDIVQIGIQPWLKTFEGDHPRFNDMFLRCSSPFLAGFFLPAIKAAYLKINDRHIRVLIYNNIEV